MSARGIIVASHRRVQQLCLSTVVIHTYSRWMFLAELPCNSIRIFIMFFFFVSCVFKLNVMSPKLALLIQFVFHSSFLQRQLKNTPICTHTLHLLFLCPTNSKPSCVFMQIILLYVMRMGKTTWNCGRIDTKRHKHMHTQFTGICWKEQRKWERKKQMKQEEIPPYAPLTLA